MGPTDMAPSKAAEESKELSADPVATGRTPGHQSRMDTERFGHLSLLDATTGVLPAPAPAPAPTESRLRRPPQSYIAESQAPSTPSQEEPTMTLLPGRTKTETTVQRAIQAQDNGINSQQTSLSQPSGGGVYLPRPDRVGTIVLNPTVAAYQPLGSSTIGNAQVSRNGSGVAFTPYQPMRSVTSSGESPHGVLTSGADTDRLPEPKLRLCSPRRLFLGPKVAGQVRRLEHMLGLELYRCQWNLLHHGHSRKLQIET